MWKRFEAFKTGKNISGSNTSCVTTSERKCLLRKKGFEESQVIILRARDIKLNLAILPKQHPPRTRAFILLCVILNVYLLHRCTHQMFSCDEQSISPKGCFCCQNWIIFAWLDFYLAWRVVLLGEHFFFVTWSSVKEVNNNSNNNNSNSKICCGVTTSIRT